MVNLRTRIRTWREHVGMRVTDLAAAVDVSTAAVAQWERSRNGTEPSHDHLAGIVRSYGITMARFWGELPPAKARGKDRP